MGELATIKIDLLPDGRVRISSVCMDRPDSSYAPLAEERAPAEVEKLLGELRSQLPSLGRAAAVLFFTAGRAPQLHAYAGDLVALLHEQGGCYRAIDSAAERDNDFSHSLSSAER